MLCMLKNLTIWLTDIYLLGRNVSEENPDVNNNSVASMPYLLFFIFTQMNIRERISSMQENLLESLRHVSKRALVSMPPSSDENATLNTLLQLHFPVHIHLIPRPSYIIHSRFFFCQTLSAALCTMQLSRPQRERKK